MGSSFLPTLNSKEKKEDAIIVLVLNYLHYIYIHPFNLSSIVHSSFTPQIFMPKIQIKLCFFPPIISLYYGLVAYI